MLLVVLELSAPYAFAVPQHFVLGGWLGVPVFFYQKLNVLMN